MLTTTPQASQAPKTGNGHKKGLLQAYELRELAHKWALTLTNYEPKDGEDAISCARDVASLIRAWSEADDRVRIHRGKPLPGTLRPERKPSKRKSRPRQVPEPITEPAVGPAAGLEQAAVPAPTPEPKPTL